MISRFMTRDDLELVCQLLHQVETNTYPNGLDLRPLAELIAARWIRISVVNGKTLIRLTAAGQRWLDGTRGRYGSILAGCGYQADGNGEGG